ncbi:MAG TPA: hypothetical protein VFH46_10835 [Pyrinomonadaceae bacterium]|jgi:hypothetical protein|nr:hypothetical protein [Pyrinomonadaceae bacterium]
MDYWGSLKSGEIQKCFVFILCKHNMAGQAEHFEQLDCLIVNVGKDDAGAAFFRDIDYSEED